MKRFLLVVALLVPIGSWAADQDGYFRPYFMINKDFNFATCQGYLLARDYAKKGQFSAINQFNQWLDGFLTAYDMYTPDTFDIAYNKNLESLNIWLDTYCAKNPNDFFNKAVESLTFELYTDRAKSRPKK